MVILKKFTEPTDIFILGCGSVPNHPEIFSTTDDYDMIDVKIGDKTIYLDIDGYCTILTRSELESVKEQFKESETFYACESCEGVLVKNFVGEIELRTFDENRQDTITDENWNRDEYLHYQEFDTDDIEISISTFEFEEGLIPEIIEK